jgi:hypothetical protein
MTKYKYQAVTDVDGFEVAEKLAMIGGVRPGRR